MIQRYGFTVCGMLSDETGDYVLHADHLTAMAEKDAEIAGVRADADKYWRWFHDICLRDRHDGVGAARLRQHYESIASRCVTVTAERDEAIARAERAEQEAAGLRADAERLDWIESQWPEGIHVEACTIGNGYEQVSKAITIYLGRPQRTVEAGTLRGAIDAARAGGGQ